MSPVDSGTYASNLKVYVHHGNSSAASRPHGLPPWFAYCSTCLRRTCWRNSVTKANNPHFTDKQCQLYKGSSKEVIRGDLNSEQPGFQHELGVMVRVQKKILPASAALRMKSTDLLPFDLLTATCGARALFNPILSISSPHTLLRSARSHKTSSQQDFHCW